MKIYDLRTENQKTPLAIDTQSPVFSWKVCEAAENWYQKSYRIVVKNDWGIVWDSGMVESRQMNQVCYEGIALQSEEAYEWTVEVCSETGERAVSECAVFETAILNENDWKAEWIGEGEKSGYHMFRQTFEIEKEIKKARLLICGLGQEECFFNGKRVGEDVLEPGWTDYKKSCLYTVHDVTALLQTGKNGVSVKLGDGMYHVPGGRYVYFERSYGKRKLLFQLTITYTDGSIKHVYSDETWKIGPSPIQFCCIYGGEDYDGRIAEKETSLASYQEDENWTSVVKTDAPIAKLRASNIRPLRVMERYQPISVTKREDGSLLYDFGKNFSGWVSIKLRTNGAMAGQSVVMTPAEILFSDGEVDQRVTGKGYAWTYICNEKEVQTFTPDFTYTGFRYVKVQNAQTTEESIKELPVIEAITGEFIYPDLEETGSFTCSNPLFEQIHEIIKQAMKSNIKSYFTDCPHREKLPWLEETHLIGPSMMCNWDLELLYEKVEQDLEDAQRKDGLVADICPEYVTGFDKWHEGFLDSPEWGSACVLNPWHLYRRYGNKRVLKRFYPAMKKYVDYLTSRTHHGMLHHGLGDWLDIGPCTPYSQNTPVPVTATCIYYIDLQIMQKTAKLLGYTEDASFYEKQSAFVKEEYNLQYLDNQTGRYANGSQACQAMSLMAGLVPEQIKEKTLRQLKDEVVKRKYAITAGDVGHPYLVSALMENGMSELLHTMTGITETPGYGYQVVHGATTLTEEWDGPEPGRPHGSQNHLMLGSIDEWFFCGLGGVNSIRRDLAFDEIEICPHIAEGMDWCEVSVGHPYGTISVSWKRMDEKVEVTVVVPPNVTATLTDIKKKVGSGIHRYTY